METKPLMLSLVDYNNIKRQAHQLLENLIHKASVKIKTRSW
ncbi:unnamed protein product [Moneuplotes crassus]|uniref:Uncharacterized protein n=1 Tax=Euplotes crassus TaxID=5936 RepID=A0AAD1XTW2_EUPCR|nr:unnamed protein product [Moneuplotes crassus]